MTRQKYGAEDDVLGGYRRGTGRGAWLAWWFGTMEDHEGEPEGEARFEAVTTEREARAWLRTQVDAARDTGTKLRNIRWDDSASDSRVFIVGDSRFSVVYEDL